MCALVWLVLLVYHMCLYLFCYSIAFEECSAVPMRQQLAHARAFVCAHDVAAAADPNAAEPGCQSADGRRERVLSRPQRRPLPPPRAFALSYTDSLFNIKRARL